MKITNLVSKEVMKDRYLKNGESLDEQIERIVTAVSEGEKLDNDKKYYHDKFKYILDNRYFVPAGRVISGAGLNKKLTLSNCFTLNFVPDSMEGIFTYVKYGALTHKTGGKLYNPILPPNPVNL